MIPCITPKWGFARGWNIPKWQFHGTQNVFGCIQFPKLYKTVFDDDNICCGLIRTGPTADISVIFLDIKGHNKSKCFHQNIKESQIIQNHNPINS